MKTKPFHLIYVLIFICFLGAVAKLNAQTFYALQIDRKLRFKAIDITAEYQPHLVMGADQALEFQQTVARFLVKKQSVEEDSKLSPSTKYSRLKRLYSRETAEMGQVLENYRWMEYMRIKPQIQPPPLPISKQEDAIADTGPTNR